jgi:hypothetical protein
MQWVKYTQAVCFAGLCLAIVVGSIWLKDAPDHPDLSAGRIHEVRFDNGTEYLTTPQLLLVDAGGALGVTAILCSAVAGLLGRRKK